VRESASDARPLAPSENADDTRHWVKVAGVPVAWFTPYAEAYVSSDEDEFSRSPGSSLKLRYGLSFLPSTGAATVVGECSVVFSDPCWTGELGDRYPLVQRDENGRTWVVPVGEAPVDDASGNQFVAVPRFFEVGLGVASTAAFVYWLVVGGLVGVAALQRRLRWRVVALTGVSAVVAGLLLAGVLAAVPAPERSAVLRASTLLPEPVEPSDAPTLEPTLISAEPHAEGCVTIDDGTTIYRCRRAEEMTAVETGDAILAVWTSHPGPRNERTLRARTLALDGTPLGPSRALLPPWPVELPRGSGSGNCELPTDLQAAALGNGHVLVAWSNFCGYRTSKPSPIQGLVLDERGRVVREPFVVATHDVGAPGAASRFWLRSTPTGDVLLVLTEPARPDTHGQVLHASVLGADLRATRATRLAASDEAFGSIAVACGSSCVVARALDGTIELTVVSAAGKVVRRATVVQGRAALRSELTAAASGDRFFVGWLESEGVNSGARLATLEPGRAPVVLNLADDVASGYFSHPYVPEPLGIDLTGEPALVWQASTGPNDEILRLQHATRAKRTEYEVDELLHEPSVVSGRLAAVAIGPVPALPDAVSVQLP
jgi:hypothetical protein